jgi:hypothetical protein
MIERLELMPPGLLLSVFLLESLALAIASDRKQRDAALIA